MKEAHGMVNPWLLFQGWVWQVLAYYSRDPARHSTYVLYFLVLYRQYSTRNFFLLEVMYKGSSVLWGTNQLHRFFCSVRNKPRLLSLSFYVSLHVPMIPIPHVLTIPLFLREPTCSHDPSPHFLRQKHRVFYMSLHGLTLSLMFNKQASRASSYNFHNIGFAKSFC